MSYFLRLWGRIPLPNRLRWAIVSALVPKFAVGIAGVILNENGEVLLFHHTYRGKRFPWGLPGGWLDPREDPALCIVREIHEETGLNVRTVRPLLIENALLVRHLTVIYLCKLVDGEFRPSSEVDAIQYFGRNTLHEMMRSQREALEMIFNLAGQL